MVGAFTPHALVSTYTTLSCSMVYPPTLGTRLFWCRWM